MRLTAIARLFILSAVCGFALLTWLRSSPDLTSRLASLKWPSLANIKGEQSIVRPDSTARPALLHFWRTWAEYILQAEPQTRPVKVIAGAPNTPAPDDPSARRQRPRAYVDLAEKDVDELKRSHAQFKTCVEDLDAAAAAKDLYTGQGVVTVAGGEYYGPSIVGIKLLRQTGSSLPVEVFLPSWDEYEPALCEHTLPALNARCVVLDDYLKAQRGLKGEWDNQSRLKITHFQLKGLALLLSSFEHVLYLDSDSIALVDPEHDLFNSEAYLTTGLVGWPDFWQGTEHPRFYEIVGLGQSFPKDLPASTSETGQLLVDKSRHLDTLLLAAYYNVWGPDFYYPLLSQGAMGEGDKETFTTAAYVLKQPYYRIKTPVKSIGRTVSGAYRGTAMVQSHPGDDFAKYGGPGSVAKRQVDKPLGPDGASIRPAFIHSNTPKMNAGHLIDEGDLEDGETGKGLRLWGPIHEQQAIFGEDLERRVWQVVLEVGCELADVMKEWRGRKNMCERLQRHWRSVFE